MLLGCMLREGRGEDRGRDRRRCSDCGMGIEEAPVPDMEVALPDVESGSRLMAMELQRSGVRRDHSAQFLRMRAAKLPRQAHLGCREDARPSARREPVAEDVATSELARIYEEASQVHTSLASKLAQHNGLKQFGADFAHRAPPLEFRMLLPALEVSIDELLEALRSLSSRLQALDPVAVDGGSTVSQVRGAIADYVTKTCEQAEAAFGEQRKHLRELAAASPLFSPTICPVLGKKLAAALGSPSVLSTAPTSPALSTATGANSTPSPVEPLRLPPKGLDLLDELSEEEEDFILADKATSRPFDSLLSMGQAGTSWKDTPAPDLFDP